MLRQPIGLEITAVWPTIAGSNPGLIENDPCTNYDGMLCQRTIHADSDRADCVDLWEGLEMMTGKRPCFRGLVLGISLLMAVAGCGVGQPVAKKPEGVRAIPVKTIAVAKTDIQPATLQPATIHAFYRAEIRAQASGFVKELKADIGDTVQAGAELAVIDVPEMLKQRQTIEARIRRLKAKENQSQAGVQLAAAKVRSSQARLAEAKAQMDRAHASVAAAEAEFNRTQDLVQRQSLQDRMLDEVRMKRDSQLADREAMASSIDLAEAEVAVAQAHEVAAHADLEAARAETDIARSELEEIDVLIGYASIRAPFSGVITERHVEPGDLVREQSEVGEVKPLFVVSQVDRVRVRIPVPEADAPLVNPGDEVTLTFPSFASEAALVGNVTRRSGSLDPSTRTMLVEAEMPNPEGKLLPGMFGQASIQVAKEIAANTLPSQAIRFEESGKAYVYLVDRNDTVSVVPITTGIDDGNLIEILSGIEAGQRVVGPHLKRFTDGQKVTVLPN